MSKASIAPFYKKRYLAFISAAVILIAILAGYFYYRYEERLIVYNQKQNLEAIADLKIEQINKWIEENIQNADNVSKNPYSLKEVEDLIKGTGKPGLKDVIINRLKYRIKSFNYENIYLTDKEGKVILAANRIDSTFDPVFLKDIKLAAEKRVTMFSDFRFCSVHNKIQLFVISPNISSKNELLGFLLFVKDPAEYLFPLIQKWPTESETGETTFYEKDGNDVLIINELRHLKNTALKLRIPLTSIDVPAVKAVNGERGIIDGIDYRGHKVLAYITDIKGTNWFINSKIDKDEIFSELKYRGYFISILVVLMVLFTATLAAFIYNSKQKNILETLIEKDKALTQSQKLLTAVGSIAKIGGWEFDVATMKGTWTKEVALILDLNTDEELCMEDSAKLFVNDSKEKFLNAVRDAIEKCTPDDLELEIITAKGNHKWIRTIGEPLVENGKLVKLQGSLQDITERKLAEDALLMKNLVFDNSIAANSISDKDGIITQANQAFLDVWGFDSIDEVCGKHVSYFIKDKNVTDEVFESLYSNDVWEGYFVAVKKDGSTFNAQVVSTSIKNERGETLGYQASVFDVTEKTVAEENLKESEMRFRTLLNDVMSIAIQGYNMEGITNYWNKASERIYGYTAEEALGKSLLETIIPQEMREGVKDAIKLMSETGEAIPASELSLLKKDGSRVNVFSSHVILKTKGREPEFYCIDIDISERKKLEETQAFLIQCGNNGENFFESLTTHLAESFKIEFVCIDVLEPDGNARTLANYVDGKFDDNITYKLKDTPCGNVVEQNICIFEKNVCRLFPNDAVLQNLKAESYAGTTLLDSKGKPIGLIAVIGRKPFENPHLVESILKLVAIRASGELERTQAEKELISSEEKYRILFESNNDGISIFYVNPDDSISNFVEVNDAATKMLGYSKSEYLQMSVVDLGEEISFDVLMERKKQLLQNKSVYYETRIKHKNGQWIDVEITITTIIYNNRLAIMNIVRDISERKKSIAALKNSEEKLRLAMQATKQGWFELDIKTGDILVSDEYKRILGYNPDDYKSSLQNWFDNIHPDDFNDVKNAFTYSLETKESTTIEYRRKTKSGKWKWIRSVGRVVDYDSKGTPLKMTGTHMDISDIKLAEEELRISEENFKNLVETMPEGYYKSTPEGKFLYVNPAMVSMFGYDSSEDLMSVYIPSDLYFKEEDRSKFNRPSDGFNTVSELYRMKKKDGSEIWLEDFSRYTRNEKGEIIMHEGVCRDVTTRKKTDEELIKAKEKAEELSRLKTNFLANMSHELRTPMVGILGFSEVLKNSLEDEEYRHYAEIIHKGGTRLMDTLNLILNISAIESDKINIELSDFDLISEIKEVVEVFEKTAIQKNLSLKIEPGFDSKFINSDKKIVHQILSNLVNNSIKYTFKGSILIKVDEVIKENKLFAGIHVIDTGIGIPADKIDLIWEDFRQVSEGLSRGFEGTGLGLSITKRFVEKLGGEIFVETSLPGFGTTFTVLFPLNEIIVAPPSDKVETVKKEYIPVNKVESESLPNALFVDDDVMSIDLIKILIKPICNLDIAINGIEAIEKAKSRKYDIILMDINLGKDIDGLETTQLIRTIRGYEKTPVIAVTALAMKHDKEDFLNKGCTHYISKPFLREEFVSLIKGVLSEK